MIMALSFSYSDIINYVGPIVFLYPEIHYVFKCFPFSFYRTNEPEIIADAPFRIDPGRDLPVLVLIKDANKYPITLKSVTISLTSGKTLVSSQCEINELVDLDWWKRIFYLKIPAEWRGETVSTDVQIDYEVLGKKKCIHNDNFAGLSHAPLKTYAAKESQPGFEDWISGDLHFHTNYTSDQVEFGAPIDVAVEMAHAVGLNFFAVTDHSYDLDDEENNFLQNDPELKKWKKSREEIKMLNKEHENNLVIIPGEEVSCANEESRNVHCLVLNHDSFLPGSGDSAERWFRTDAELQVGEIVDKVSSSGLIIAAHPKDPVPFLEKVLIHRGIWTDKDCRIQGIAGLQILNGLDNRSFKEGLQQWIRQLLDGEKRYIFAGNDAHGNFNRYRQVKIPMLSLQEIESHQPFGWARTSVWMDHDELNVENIIKHLRNGNALITNGPLVMFTVQNEGGELFHIGETATGKKIRLILQGKTNDELGEFAEIKIIAGEIGHIESLIKSIRPDGASFEMDIELSAVPFSYLRCEARTFKNMFCYTNPIWLNKS